LNAPLDVSQISAKAQQLDLEGAKVHHLPDWGGYDDPKKLQIIREISEQRGRDPRIASLAVRIIKEAKCQPREYKKQAAALLAWVQDPKNIFYINEPGERLQDPIYTIKKGYGDCFVEDTLVLRDDMNLVPIQDVKIGDRIWGRDRWSHVVQTWDKGELDATEIELNNGSVLRLTPGHKVYVRSCEKHGTACPDIIGKQTNCRTRTSSWVRVHVSELRPGMELLAPDAIVPEGAETSRSADESWFVGAYIAEGWQEPSRVMLSGKTGYWKEATKQRASEMAQARGWSVRMHDKYIAINSKEAVELVMDCGGGALNKRIPVKLLREGDLSALDEGLRLDASRNSRGEGWTLGTVSEVLATQYRVLQRCLGRSTSIRRVENHGGFGSNPIYRVSVRNPKLSADKRLRVKALRPAALHARCYDIATDDHYVYLPEGDCTVSNCDDQVLVLCALFESVRLPWKLVISGLTMDTKQKVRHIEGGPYPPNTNWSHIYCMVGTPAFNPKQWFFCESTVPAVPLGWDVVGGDRRFLPEMDKPPPGPARIMAPPRAPSGFQPPALPNPRNRSPVYAMALGSTSYAVGAAVAEELEDEWAKERAQAESPFDKRKILLAILSGIVISAGTQLALDWVRGTGVHQGKGPGLDRVKDYLSGTMNNAATAGSM
jgi:hypothetical protein